MTDPWAAAQVATAPPATAATPAGSGQGGSVEGATYAQPKQAGSLLFSGPQGNFYPALFNKTHAPGTRFRGQIISPPKDVQSTSYPRQAGDPRLPQYWCTGADGKRKPGTDAIDPRTGEKNDPVMDLLIELQTDCRFDAQTLIAIGRETTYEDDGKRAFQCSGSRFPKGHKAGEPTNAVRAVLDAIEAAVAAGLPIVDDESMVGLWLDVVRVRRIDPSSTTSPWLYVAKLEK